LQSLVTTLLALVIGLTVGVVLGRWAWRSFARGIGLVDTPVPLVIVGTAALAGAAVVGFAPSLRIARRSHSRVPRGE
jgi:ABC-type spermidine/putrescine transport system permease subunit II